jgi:hypothetical protein
MIKAPAMLQSGFYGIILRAYPKKAQDGGGSTFRANRQMHLCLSRALAIKRERTARLFQAADSIWDMLLILRLNARQYYATLSWAGAFY